MQSYPIIKKFILEVLAQMPEDTKAFERAKKQFVKKHKIEQLKNPQIMKSYLTMTEEKMIAPCPALENLLKTKQVRSASGVVVVAVLTKPYPCPGQCIYCPSEKMMPKSYLSNEPAVMRAKTFAFNPYQQVQARLQALKLGGHPTDKIELIIMGGTFNFLPRAYQTWFVGECFRAANDYPKQIQKRITKTTLKKEQIKNEQASARIIGLTLETRPDYINKKEIQHFRNLGCTRVELGVQSIYNDVLKINRRGHWVEKTIQATALLRDAGFKINYHIMPGLLGSTFAKDLAMLKTLFSSSDFQPDMLKIYPCVVTEFSQLYALWQAKKYKPYTNKKIQKLLLEIKKNLPPYVRVNRLIRDIPEPSILAGPNISNLRQLLKEQGAVCQCIRCREIQNAPAEMAGLALNRIDYLASNGQEIFLQYIDPESEKLYALLRLRIPSFAITDKRLAHHENIQIKKNTERLIFNVLKNSALVRELHTFGKTSKIAQKNITSVQHKGLGKKLLQEAEKIAKEEFGLKKIAVISGIGARDYYRKNGYRLKQTYMLKNL